MSEDAAIRRTNLHRICRGRNWSPSQLRDAAGFGRYSLWFDLLNNAEKSFGEKLARRIEDALHLPRRWLDEVELPIPPHGIKESDPVFARPMIWPFSADLFDVVQLLEESEMARLEAVMRAHLGEGPAPSANDKPI